MTTESFDVRIESVAVQDNLVRFTYRLYAQHSEHPAHPAKPDVHEAHIKLPTEGLRASNIAHIAGLAELEVIKDLQRAGVVGSC